MGDGRITPFRPAWLVASIITVLALVALFGACSTTPAQEPSAQPPESKAATSTDRPATATETAKQVEPAKVLEPAQSTEAAKPVAAVNGCVTCHTSKENVKKTSAPPAPAVTSAEQSGEG